MLPSTPPHTMVGPNNEHTTMAGVLYNHGHHTGYALLTEGGRPLGIPEALGQTDEFLAHLYCAAIAPPPIHANALSSLERATTELPRCRICLLYSAGPTMWFPYTDGTRNPHSVSPIQYAVYQRASTNYCGSLRKETLQVASWVLPPCQGLYKLVRRHHQPGKWRLITDLSYPEYQC